jgi:hypothetical protein
VPQQIRWPLRSYPGLDSAFGGFPCRSVALSGGLERRLVAFGRCPRLSGLQRDWKCAVLLGCDISGVFPGCANVFLQSMPPAAPSDSSMAGASLKDLRLADAAAAPPYLNPCLRCLSHYKTSFGAEKAIMCQFGAEASLQDDLVADDGSRYRMCGNCVKSGQHCLEVCPLAPFGRILG